jgi:hypothetical protein
MRAVQSDVVPNERIMLGKYCLVVKSYKFNEFGTVIGVNDDIVQISAIAPFINTQRSGTGLAVELAACAKEVYLTASMQTGKIFPDIAGVVNYGYCACKH